jgi:hypothetical protein
LRSAAPLVQLSLQFQAMNFSSEMQKSSCGEPFDEVTWWIEIHFCMTVYDGLALADCGSDWGAMLVIYRCSVFRRLARHQKMMSRIMMEDKTANAIQMRLMATLAGPHRTFTMVLIGFVTREQLVSPSNTGNLSKMLWEAANRGSNCQKMQLRLHPRPKTLNPKP